MDRKLVGIRYVWAVSTLPTRSSKCQFMLLDRGPMCRQFRWPGHFASLRGEANRFSNDQNPREKNVHRDFAGSVGLESSAPGRPGESGLANLGFNSQARRIKMATCLGCDPEMGDGKALCRVSGAVAFISCEPGASARNWFMDFRFLASASAKKINEVALAESGRVSGELESLPHWC